MKKLFSDNRIIIAITVFALILRVSSFVLLRPWDEKVEKERIVRCDAIGYQSMALNLLTAGQFKATKFTPIVQDDKAMLPIHSQNFDSLRTPGYPIYLFIIYYVFGVKVYLALFFQIILNIISLILTFKIAMSIFKSAQVANVAALLFAIEPHQISHCFILYTDTLFVTLFLLFSFLLIKGLQNKRLFYFVFSAIILGVCILVRPIAKFIPFVLIIVLFYSPVGAFSFKMKVATLYFLISTLIISPWLFRNYREYGHLGLCTDQGITLLVRNASNTEALRTHTPNIIIEANLQKQANQYGFDSTGNPFENEAICSKVAINSIKQHPLYYIETHIKGMISMFFSIDHRSIAMNFGIERNHSNASQFPFYSISFTRFFADNIIIVGIGLYILLSLTFNYVLFIIGTFFMLKHQMTKALAMIVLIMIYFSSITGVLGLEGGARFKLPIMPFICIVAGYGCYQALRKRDKNY